MNKNPKRPARLTAAAIAKAHGGTNPLPKKRKTSLRRSAPMKKAPIGKRYIVKRGKTLKSLQGIATFKSYELASQYAKAMHRIHGRDIFAVDYI